MGSFTRGSRDGGEFIGGRNQSADTEVEHPVRRLIYGQTNSRQQSRASRGSGRTNRVSGFHHRWTGRFQ
jgi:hypothetical protein